MRLLTSIGVALALALWPTASHAAVITGTSGPDYLVGTTGADQMDGGMGDDIIAGRGGADYIDGDGIDYDQIVGHLIFDPGFDDRIVGGAGTDELHGNVGEDRILGGSDNDLLYGEEDDDWLEGNDGDDLLYGGESRDRLQGDAGDDQLLGGDDDDELFGDADNDVLRGGKGSDRLSGNSGHDELLGDSGPDHLYGGPGNDRLYGGTGSDVLCGGEGDDILIGGPGRDLACAVADHYVVQAGVPTRLSVTDNDETLDDASEDGPPRYSINSDNLSPGISVSIDKVTGEMTVTATKSGIAEYSVHQDDDEGVGVVSFAEVDIAVLPAGITIEPNPRPEPLIVPTPIPRPRPGTVDLRTPRSELRLGQNIVARSNDAPEKTLTTQAEPQRAIDPVRALVADRDDDDDDRDDEASDEAAELPNAGGPADKRILLFGLSLLFGGAVITNSVRLTRASVTHPSRGEPHEGATS